MTKIALVADVHLANHRRWGGAVSGGLNRRGREAVDVLRRAAVYASEQGCAALFVLGDLFDTSRPSPPLVAAAIDALEAGPKAYVILGNHDRQTQDERDHACAPMIFTRVEVVSKNCCYRFADLLVACVPYQPGEASTWLPQSIFEAKGGGVGRTIVLTHLGIWDEDTPPYLKSARDAVGIGQVRWLCDTHKVDAFFAGNWHHYKCWAGPPYVLIPGTLCPHTFSDAAKSDSMLTLAGSVGDVVIYDSSTNVAIPHRIPGPRFVTTDLAGAAVAQASSLGSAGMTYYKLRVPREQLDAALAMQTALESGSNAMVEVELVGTEAVVQRAAIEAIKASEGDLVEAYADLADVQEPGTKEGVARRLAEYRKAAG